MNEKAKFLLHGQQLVLTTLLSLFSVCSFCLLYIGQISDDDDDYDDDDIIIYIVWSLMHLWLAKVMLILDSTLATLGLELRSVLVPLRDLTQLAIDSKFCQPRGRCPRVTVIKFRPKCHTLLCKSMHPMAENLKSISNERERENVYLPLANTSITYSIA